MRFGTYLVQIIGTGMPQDWDGYGTVLSLLSRYHSIQKTKTGLLLIIVGFEQNFSENTQEFEEVHHESCHHSKLLVSGQHVPDLYISRGFSRSACCWPGRSLSLLAASWWCWRAE